MYCLRSKFIIGNTTDEKKRLVELLQYEQFQSNLMREEGAIDRIYQKVAENETGESEDVAKDVSMQAAAMKPLYLNPSDVPADVLDNEKNVLKDGQCYTGG